MPPKRAINATRCRRCPTVFLNWLRLDGKREPDYHVDNLPKKSTACDPDHKSSRRGQSKKASRSFCGWGVRAMEGAMLKVEIWNKSVPRAELDQRARDARLQFERMEQL